MRVPAIEGRRRRARPRPCRDPRLTNFSRPCSMLVRARCRRAERLRTRPSSRASTICPFWRAFGCFSKAWANARTGDRERAHGCDRGARYARTRNILERRSSRSHWPRLEARGGEADAPSRTIDEALARAERTGLRWYEAELHRIRGEILLKRDPATPRPRRKPSLPPSPSRSQQGARSFELRAALTLAKLYQSTARPADAHAVLGPALEGFSPTPEMPEIAEAQALLRADAAARSAQASRRQS